MYLANGISRLLVRVCLLVVAFLPWVSYGKSLTPISKWRPLTSKDFTADQKAKRFSFECGIADAELSIVKTYSGTVLIKKDARVGIGLDKSPLSSAGFLATDKGKEWLTFLNRIWIACRNAAIEYEASLDQLSRKATNLLNQKSNGFVAMPTKEKLTRIFLVPKSELFYEYQKKLCKLHQSIVDEAPEGVRWKAKSCRS